MQYQTKDHVRLVTEDAAARRLQQTAARLCFWMCDLHIVDDSKLEAAASETTTVNYKLIDEYRTEFFSLLISYDIYRYYMSMASGRIVPDWFAGREIRDVLELCGILARTPYNSDLVFERLAQ